MSNWTDEKHDEARSIGFGFSFLEPGICELVADAVTEIDRLRDERASGETSDGYHTHNELYRYRMLYNAHAARGWVAQGLPVVKSWRHADGELCFGGGWFIVTATMPTGQVSNHYEAKHWDLFDVPDVVYPPEWDGHTPEDAADRLENALPLI